MPKTQIRKEPKAKGSPKKDLVERLRVTLWYLDVKQRRGWSDYRLDQEFAWVTDRDLRSGSDRLRVFETVRRRRVVPSSGDRLKRSFDLISRVDSHADFAGTEELFNSPFWSLLKGDPMDLPEAKEFVSHLLPKHKLHRPSNELFIIINLIAAGVLNEHRDSAPITAAQLYEVSLTQATAGLSKNLDFLALLGGLFREAYLVCALEVSVVLKRLFLTALEDYCSQDWLKEIATDLMELGERRVLHWQMAEHFDGSGLYPDWPPIVVERPLFKLDDAMLQLISKEQEISDAMWANFVNIKPDR
ncbi:hypothetical protein ACO0LD_26620 [Undibacterium sp. Ji83W]|uniref:hypothetical protein n=1 Tax=Undibacterium sp. Ji83W TaxID=3413043 RepID=UPI003BF1E1C5